MITIQLAEAGGKIIMILGYFSVSHSITPSTSVEVFANELLIESHSRRTLDLDLFVPSSSDSWIPITRKKSFKPVYHEKFSGTVHNLSQSNLEETILSYGKTPLTSVQLVRYFSHPLDVWEAFSGISTSFEPGLLQQDPRTSYRDNLYRADGSTIGNCGVYFAYTSEVRDVTLSIEDNNVYVLGTVYPLIQGRTAYSEEEVKLSLRLYNEVPCLPGPEQFKVKIINGARSTYNGDWFGRDANLPVIDLDVLMYMISSQCRNTISSIDHSYANYSAMEAECYNQIKPLDMNNIENGLQVASTVSAVIDIVKVLKTKKPSKRLFSKLKDDIKAIKQRPVRSMLNKMADGWLTHKYTISTSISDLEEIVACLSSGDEQDSAVYRDSIDSNIVYSRTSSTSEEGVICRVTVACRNDNGTHGLTLSSLNNVGLMPTASNLWDLIPFSFVVDWFLDVGENLRQLDHQLGYDYNGYSKIGICYTKSAVREINVYGQHINVSYFKRECSIGAHSFEAEYNIGSPTSLADDFSIMESLTPQRVITAFSLFVQRI